MKAGAKRAQAHITVAALTNEPLIALGLGKLIASSPDFRVLACCPDFEALSQSARSLHPHLVVLSLDTDFDLSVVTAIREILPEAGVVLLSREMSPELARAALDLGVRAAISTTAAVGTMLECLRTAARGELWLDRSLSMDLLQNRPVRLTRRQGQLVSLLVQGLKNKEIAAVLGLSEATVKAYLTTLFEKVGAKDRFELAVYGLKNLKYIRDTGVVPGLWPKAPSSAARRSRAQVVA